MFKHTQHISVLMATVASLAFVAPTALAGPDIVITDYVGQITIETSPNGALFITERINAGDVDISQSDIELEIDGNIKRPDSDKCQGYYGNISFNLFGRERPDNKVGGYENLDTYPHLSLSAPSDASIIIRNSIIFGEVGDIGSADIDIKYCGDIEIGKITDQAQININGSGDVSTGDIGALTLDINGSGDVDILDADSVDLAIRGSGDFEAMTIGNFKGSVSGSGDVEIGTISQSLTFTSRGSGDLDVDTANGELKYSSQGSGDLDVETVSAGRIDITTRGSGDVTLRNGTARELIIDGSGSSDIRFRGVADSAELKASGATDIYVNRVTGNLKSSESGAGDIHIKN